MTIRNSRDVAESTIKLINARRSGEIKSLPFPWDKVNRVTMGGIEYGSLLTVGGLSGHGKTSLAGMIHRSFQKEEPNLVTLYFSLEMAPERLYVRDIASMINVPVRVLFSADEPINDSSMELVNKCLSQMATRQNYYVSDKCTVQDLVTTVKAFRKSLDDDTPLLIIIDHALLVSSEGRQEPKERIDALQEELNMIKKQGQTVIIQLSQLNREIESVDRIKNKTMHYPMEKDLSTSSNMYQLSDYVIVIHIPEKLNIIQYGYNSVGTKDKVFLHLIKNRDAGDTAVFVFKNDLKHNKLIDESTEKSTDGNDTTAMQQP